MSQRNSGQPWKRLAGGIIAGFVALASVGLVSAGGAGATAKVRGFDGTTIKLGGMGIAQQFGNVPTGVQARVKKFNDTNEIKGIKLDYVGLADDKGDPATSLSEARRLVTQEQVFAFVGQVSQSNPGDYLKQQQVPYFGWAFDNTYCSHNPSTQIWGFGYNGCLVPSDPAWMPDAGRPSFPYVQKVTGKKNPTLTVLSSDSQSGKNSVKFQSIAYAGIGYKVVAKLNSVPFDPSSVGDYSPYITELLTSDNGKAPDSIICLMATQCINIFQGLKAQSYEGVFISSLYSNILVKALDGSAANITYVNFNDDTKGTRQIKADVDAYQPGASAKLDSGMFVGYASTDMFIQALKTVAKKGKSNITPAAVQKAASVQTWSIPELAGPTQYPQATVGAYQSCNSEVVSDGTTWKTVTPFACSKKQYPVKG